MKNFGIYILSISLLLAANAQGQVQSAMSLKETERSSFLGEWKVGLSGTDNHDERSQSKKVDFRLDLKAKYHLTSYLLLDVQPAFRLQSGQTQSVDGADSAENKLLLNQAAMDFQPSKYFKFMAGALNQRSLHNQLLLDKIAFPAARAETMFNSTQVESGFALETAIPTSTSMSANTSELEPTPTFNTASASLNWLPSKRAFWKNRAGFFSFKNLPSAVAQKSQFLGNGVNSISEADYKFKYEYEGLEASTEISIPVLNRLTLLAGADYTQNQKAPTDLNAASFYWGGAELFVNRNFSVQVTGGRFAIAPDSAVAYFSTLETNRVGYSVESIFKFQRERFNLSVKFQDAETMYQSDTQSREQTLQLKLETSYANI
ncbi:hypothetical protein [Bdellovibrio sp. HCB2-146]|uniref:hypothetical protein n=1 Tax=Bdellovibrio sp. HCB2-146 TaxID=3394362 RepID=UPI0039BC5089